MAIGIIGTIGYLIFRFIFLDKLVYQNSINLVPRIYRFNKNTIRNDRCTITYTPCHKIVVMDNLANNRGEKRMFTLTKRDININRSWHKICRIFDEYTGLDALEAFFNLETFVNTIVIESPKTIKKEPTKQINTNKTQQNTESIEMDKIKPDPYTKNTNIPNTAEQEFVNIDKIQEAKQIVEQKQQTPDFVDFGDIFEKTSNKINVNTATASEISILPGINIVMAKKIIEHRNTKGLFNNENEFLEIAEVKEHFVEKVRSMITTAQSAKQNNNDDFDEGRIVDL